MARSNHGSLACSRLRGTQVSAGRGNNEPFAGEAGVSTHLQFDIYRGVRALNCVFKLYAGASY